MTSSASMSRALVLGGGGSTGVAWLVGMMSGLAEGGVDIRRADSVIGTSAGSIVGARVAAGQASDDMAADVIARSDGKVENAAMAALDLDGLLAIMAEWEAMSDNTPASCARIGKLAQETSTMSLHDFLQLTASEVAAEWPPRPFTAVAVEANTGELAAFSRESGLSLHHAIASSICVPGIFPPVVVGDAVYVDGGVRSGTSADLAVGFDDVLVLAPIGSRSDGMDPMAARAAVAECEQLRDAGATVTLTFPDDQSNDVIGLNRMDPSIGAQVMAQGHRQGLALAAELTGRW
jgi:NTE family protein